MTRFAEAHWRGVRGIFVGGSMVGGTNHRATIGSSSGASYCTISVRTLDDESRLRVCGPHRPRIDRFGRSTLFCSPSTALELLGLVSRAAMMRGLMEVEGGGSALPFVRQFCGSPSTNWWDGDEGVTHEIRQRRGEQGDALMPALFSLLHAALSAVDGVKRHGW